MAKKTQPQICVVCKKYFESDKTKKTCSKECSNKLKSQKASKRYENNTKIVECKFCQKKFKTGISHILKFCSKECYDNWQKKDGEEQLLNRRKISNTLTGKSLIDRGYSNKAINAWITAGQKASVKNCKGKKIEEYLGIEKATKLRQRLSETQAGNNNNQSLESLSKKHNCSLEDARKYTVCYGRSGNKHPMFGKQQTDEAVNNMTKKLIEKCKYVSIGYFNEILWQGSYELAYLAYSYENKLNIKRYDLDPIKYIYENKIHRYYPDFILNDKIIIECKGKSDDKVDAKKKAAIDFFGKENYLFLDIKYIKTIRPNCSVKNYFKIIKEKYGELFKVVYLPKRYENDFEIREYLIENKS